jgi:colanic acid/amylovoran biosynthesis protein
MECDSQLEKTTIASIPHSSSDGFVCLMGVTKNTNNYGVRVLLSGAVEAIARANHGVRICILDYGREPVNWKESTQTGDVPVRVINLRFSWRLYLRNNIFRLLAVVALSRLLLGRPLRERLWRRNRWLKQALDARTCCALAGGDSFSDIYGLERLLYVALPQVLVLLLGKPLVQLPQTYGPFRSRASRAIAGYLLRRSQLICSRDRKGATTVGEILGHSSPLVEVVPDLGFLMEPEPVRPEVLTRLEAFGHKRLLVGLNVSKLLYMGGYTRSNMFGLREEYPALVRHLITFLIHELGATVLLVPHVYGGPESEESEVTLNRQLLAELQPKYGERVVFLDENLNHRQVKTIIGCCDLFIGARMHACIAAVSQFVPTVALAYSDKFAGVMEVVGNGARVVDLRSMDTAGVLGVVRDLLNTRSATRSELTRKIPEIRSRIHSLFERSLRPVLSKPRCEVDLPETLSDQTV